MLRVGGTDGEGMTGVPCGLCGTGKDGESTIIENDTAADFPVTKLEDEEAGSNNGFRSCT